MRLRVALVLFVVAAIAVGCGSPKGRLFATEFAAIDGDPIGSIDIEGLPVVLHDRTGTVTSIETSQVRPQDQEGGEFTRGRADSAPEQANAIRVLWLGGACEANVEMQLTRPSEPRLVLTIHAPFDFLMYGLGCPALGVPRAVTIGFDRPVDAHSVDVRTDLDD